jgi:serine/threonine-protein kinase RIO1
LFHEAIGILADMFLNAQFVHGDFSDHNLMVTQNGLVTMDVSQSVQYNQKTFVETPIRLRIDKAFQVFKTDLMNLNQSFRRKFRLSIDVESVSDQVILQLPKKLQGFLQKSELFFSGSQFVPELYELKARYRRQSQRKKNS